MLSTLDILFSSAARVQLLHLFFSHSDSQFYQREIERETGQPIRAVQREVKRLEEMGLLDRSTEGNRVFYRLTPEFPLLEELAALFQSATGDSPAERPAKIPPEPSTVGQPFSWIETPPTPPLPSSRDDPNRAPGQALPPEPDYPVEPPRDSRRRAEALVAGFSYGRASGGPSRLSRRSPLAIQGIATSTHRRT